MAGAGGVTFQINAARWILAKRGLQERGRVQKVLDSEIIRKCEPYIPLRDGELIKSGTRNTKLGEGRPTWKTPYARKRFYDKHVGTPTGALRGGFWFQRMWNAHGRAIMNVVIEEAKKGGGSS